MDCVFCKIALGELPSFKICEDDATFAILDSNPVNAGHTLVMPKRHSKNIFEISAEDWAAVANTVHKMAIAIETALNADGVNIMMNNREHAGQQVDHAHMHVIPRFKNDGLRLWPQRKYREDEAEETLAKIRKAL